MPVDRDGLNVSAIRRRLTHVLPAGTMPARFVALDAVPVTANHKIDRGALPILPSIRRPTLDEPFLAPRSDLEATIASVWAETLDLDVVGVRDDFFDLGGDSLDAAAMLAHLSHATGRALPDFSVFERPTVERLAQAIAALDSVKECRLEASDTGRSRSPLVRVQPAGTRRPFFFLHAEYGGDGSYCLNVARHLGADQPFYGLSPLGQDGEPVPGSIEAMAAAYLAIVRQEQSVGPYSIGGFCSGAVVAWEMACQLRESGAEVGTLVLIEPPAVDGTRVARAIHAAARIAARLGIPPEIRARFVGRSLRLARLRYLPRGTSTLWRLPALIRRCLQDAIPAAVDRRAVISGLYGRAVDAYLPRLFDGPVLCLQAIDEANEAALHEWRRQASGLTTRRVPGDHNSCIVTHGRALALALTSDPAGLHGRDVVETAAASLEGPTAMFTATAGQ